MLIQKDWGNTYPGIVLRGGGISLAIKVISPRNTTLIIQSFSTGDVEVLFKLRSFPDFVVS